MIKKRDLIKRSFTVLVMVAILIGLMPGNIMRVSATAETFTVAIGGVDTDFKVLTQSGNIGTVQIGHGHTSAIPETTTGVFIIPETVVHGGIT